MNHKGFTLIELTGVIILLSLISLLVIPSIDGAIKVFKQQAYNSQIQNIALATKDWTVDNLGLNDYKVNDTITITLGQLKVGGYIDENLANPKTQLAFADDMQINITRSKSTFRFNVLDTTGAMTGTYEGAPIITLNGSYIERISYDSAYLDQGVSAKTSSGVAITTINKTFTLNGSPAGSVVTTTPGTYLIAYSVTDNSITRAIYRTVIVTGSAPTLTLANTTNLTSIADGNRAFTAGQHYFQEFPSSPNVLLKTNTTYTIAYNYYFDAANINEAIGNYYLAVGYGDTFYKADIVTSNYSNLMGRKVVTFTTPASFNAAHGTPYLQLRFITTLSATAYATANVARVIIAEGTFTHLDYVPYYSSGVGISIVSDSLNLYNNQSPSTNGGSFTNDVTLSKSGPIKQAKTWEITKTGTANQWSGYQSYYGNVFNGNANDLLVISGYYKTSNTGGLTNLNVGGLYKPAYAGSFSTTTLSTSNTFILDNEWHPFYVVQRVNEQFGLSIVNSAPAWDYTKSSGKVYLNNITWKIAAPTAASADRIFLRRYAKGNQTLKYFQDGGGIAMLSNSVNIKSNGLYTFYVEDYDGVGTIKTYTVSGIPAPDTLIAEVLVVAGGGGGGSRHGGGGGGGGYLVTNYNVTDSSTSVVVGNGGTGGLAFNGAVLGFAGSSGENSTFGSLTAFGGGGGGSNNISGVGIVGGSGGGGNAAVGGGSGLQPSSLNGGSGNNGGAGVFSTYYMGGGGGGAGSVGGTAVYPNAGTGGTGISNNISGVAVTYSAGGNGGNYSLNTATVHGTANTGTGGGGTGGETNNGGNGGSGIVIVKYPGTQKASGGIISYIGGYTIHKFTSSGTFVKW